MIRINLIAKRKAPKASFDLSRHVPILCSLVLLAAALLIGWRFWTMRQRSAVLDEEIQRAQQEAQSLRAVMEQVQQFEQRKSQLQQRVALIEDLRQGQSGPVHLLDEISRALPDRLWLTDLKQDTEAVKLEGRTTSLTSLSDFVSNLEASGYFSRPVEIVDSRVESQQASVDVIKFTVRAQFLMPGSAARSAAAATVKASE
jgi:type IV pilus assembly protein PilN